MAGVLLKSIPILRSKWIYYCWRANLFFRDYKEFDCIQPRYKDWPAKDVFVKFCIDERENKRFKSEMLNQLKISSEYVCFHSRDEAYKKKVKTSETNISYQSYRNSRFSSYNKAAKVLKSKGILPVRVGQVVQEEVTSEFWDYSLSNLQSDKNDILILANCKFWVMTNSGYTWVPQIFGKPGIACNLVPFSPEFLWHYPKGTVVLPKNFFTEEGFRVPFDQLISQDGFNYDENRYIETYLVNKKLTLKENTDDEIEAAIIEYYDVHISREKTIDYNKQFLFWNGVFPDIAFELSRRVIVASCILEECKLD